VTINDKREVTSENINTQKRSVSETN